MVSLSASKPLRIQCLVTPDVAQVLRVIPVQALRNKALAHALSISVVLTSERANLAAGVCKLVHHGAQVWTGGLGMAKIEVVGAIIITQGKLLAAKRAANRTLGGYWEFPGGKIEPGETPKQALARELNEEFGASATIFNRLEQAGRGVYAFGEVVLHCYYARLDTPISKTIAHDELREVNPEEALNLQWAPTDVPVIEQLVKDGFGYEY